MKKVKKWMAVVLAALFVVTMLPTSAKAASMFDEAIEMDPWEFFSEDFGKDHAPVTTYYAITLTRTGTVSLNCAGVDRESYSDCMEWKMMDSYGTIVAEGKMRDNAFARIDNVSKGTYYISLYANGQIYSYTNFYYTFTPDKTPLITLSITLPVGAELQLNATVENSSDKVTWTSTKKSVATISRKGLVVTKKKGTAWIKAVLPTGESAKIKVKVK